MKARCGLALVLLLCLVPAGGQAAPPHDDACASVRLNEFLPYPASDWNRDCAVNYDDQWVELYNGGGAACDLGGWQLATAKSAPGYTIPAGTTLGPGGYLVLYYAQTHLDMGRWSGEVWLRSPSGALDGFVYTYALADQSWSRATSGSWDDGLPPSPGQANGSASAPPPGPCTATPRPATATPLASDTPPSTSTPAPSATSVPTATEAPAATATHTPSPTHTPSLTRTPSPTHTPSLTRTPSPTHTPSLTRTPSPTRTPSLTRTPSPTGTGSLTLTPTLAGTRRPTPMATPPAASGTEPTAAATPVALLAEAGLAADAGEAVAGQEATAIAAGAPALPQELAVAALPALARPLPLLDQFFTWLAGAGFLALLGWVAVRRTRR